jgi:hypothetical protein
MAALLLAPAIATAQDDDGDFGGSDDPGDDGSGDDGAADQGGDSTDDDPYEEGGDESPDGTTDDDPEPGGEAEAGEAAPTGPAEGTGADFEPGAGGAGERPARKDGVELPPPEPFLPNLDDRAEYDDAALEEALDEVPDGRPFAKGEMELGVGLGMAGYGDQYYMMLGAAFGYYVVNGLAPGLDVNYTTDFDSAGFADSVTLLPFLKWVFYRGKKFSPYVIGGAGREFQWAGDYPVHSWIAGLGFGAHIGIGSHVMIKIQIMFMHHWYDETAIHGQRDAILDCGHYIDGNGDSLGILAPETCTRENDDVGREWIYPIINLGASFMF